VAVDDVWRRSCEGVAALVRIVVSERRPPGEYARNWLPLRGHTLGSAQFRLSRLDAPMPEIGAEVVAVDTLPG